MPSGYMYLKVLTVCMCSCVIHACAGVCVCRPGNSTSCYSSGAVLVLAVDGCIDHKTRSLTDLEFTQ